MNIIFDPISFINLLFCIGIVIISIWWSREAKSQTPLYIGIAFGLFAISHAAVLLDLRSTFEHILIIVRISAYLLVFVGLFFVARDVLQRKEAEESLRENGEFLANILENIPDMIFLKDAESLRFVRLNRAGEELLGYSRDELIGRDSFDLFPREEAVFVTEKDRQVLQERILFDIPEEPVQTRGRGARIFHTKKIPIYQKDGTPQYLLGISSDITEHKKAERELIRKNDELSAAYEELAAASEELKHNYDELTIIRQALDLARKKLNLLNHVTFNIIQNSVMLLSGYLQLEEDTLTDTNQIEYHQKIKRILETIEKTLVFSQNFQGMGIDPPRWQRVDLVFLFAISHLEMQHFSRKIAPLNLEIFADPLLEKVFFNLAENVILHGKTATEMRLGGYESDDGFTITFEDNGVGIPDSLKEVVFSQGYGKRKGMGLFLIREILSITGITIIENGVPEKGVRFEIAVPKGAWRYTTGID
jgi:PAS domain S-box-containing protein